MRVAYVCTDRGVPVFGHKGSSIHAQEVMRGMRAHGADVTIFARRLGGRAPAKLTEVRVHRLPRGGETEGVARERAALAANPSIAAALERTGPYDLVYERHALWSHAAMEHARGVGATALLEVNAPLIEEQQRYRTLTLAAEAEASRARAYAAADALIAVSDAVAAHLRAHPATRGAIHVVPNGVDVDRFTPSRGSRRHRGFTVGFVGSLKPWHGVDVLLDAFIDARHRDPELRLLIVGDGPERRRLEARAAAATVLDTVTFTGAVDSDRIPAMLTWMDVAVAPYPAFEEFYFSPLKIYEYMAAGRAIVASAVGQVAEVIDHKITGLLVSPGDRTALADAVVQLKSDEPLRVRLGAAARRVAIERHAWDRVIDRIVDIARSAGSSVSQGSAL